MVSVMKKISLALLLVLLPAAALAIEPTSPSSLIAQAQGDRSMDLLGKIFGDYFGLAKQVTPLSQMFGALNMCLSTVAVFLLIWSGCSSIVITAHTGQWLGKKHDALWVPVRFVVGLAGFIPFVGGFCLAQLFMYYAAATGVGVANVTAKYGVEAMISSGANKPIVSAVALSKDTTMQSLLKAQVCAIAYNSQYYDAKGQPLADGVPPPFDARPGEVARGADGAVEGIAVYDYRYSYGGTGNYDYAPDYCGGVTIPAGAGNQVDGVIGPLISHQEVRKAHITALQQMSTDLWPISWALYHDHKKPDSAALAGIRNQYNATVQAKITAVVGKNARTMQQVLASNGMTDAKHSWIELGGIFNRLAKIHREIHDAVNVDPEPLPALANENDAAASRAVYGLSLANAFISQSDSSQRVAESGESAEGGGKLALLLRKIEFSAIQKALQAFVLGEDDLLTGMTNFGYTSFTALLGGLAAMFGLAGVFGLLNTAIGTGIIGWATLLLIGPIAFCLMCAFYLPFLPFIYWWGGVISWVIVVVEGFVAAPLWMVTHLTLDGDGMGQRAEPGYIFVLNLLLRPVLMVIGLVAAWLASNALGELLRYSLGQLYFSGSANTSSVPIIGTGLAGIVQFFGVIILFGYLGIVTLKHCYSMITVIPDQVLGWIGRTAQSVGGNIEQTIHHDVGGVAGKAGGEATQAVRQRLQPGGGRITPKPGEN